MHVRWSASGSYDEVGGKDLLLGSIREAASLVPLEHQRGLGGLIVLDDDPRGTSLGVWQPRREGGADIELYLSPHIETTSRAVPGARPFALKLYLAHTIYHEVGHHRTLSLNRRTRPSKTPREVDHALERWAEEYVPGRLQRLIDVWRAPGGPASDPSGLADLIAALRFLRIDAELVPNPP